MEEALSRLEKALQSASDRMRNLRQEAEQLRQELEGLKAENHQKRQLLGRYGSERLEVRSRVANALEKIAGLEGPR